jgi:CBS-domain-containing membrane protein
MGLAVAALQGLTAGDVMLPTPKTLRPDVSVQRAREALADEHVQMLLIADGTEFRGAITAIPDDADPLEPALRHVDQAAETTGPTEPAEAAFEQAKKNPYRRVVVLDQNRTLLGLICLNKTLTGFCTASKR